MKKFITSIFSLLLLLTITSAHAETTRYNIEIVIFEDSSDRYLNSEQWPVIHHPENIPTTDLTNQKSDTFPIIDQEPESKNKQAKYPESNSVINVTHHTSDALAAHVARLIQSSRYKVLFHQSWQQTGLSNTDAINIQVDTTRSNNKEEHNVAILNPAHQLPDISNQKLKSNIQGTLKLVLGRYLHIHTDLLYKRLNNVDKQTFPTLDSKVFSKFKIKSQRRMRSKELHYIDHPLLGILVHVIPIEQPRSVRDNNESIELKAVP